MNKINHGFTIIELMVTVAIIGILASVALPVYENYTKKALFSEVILATDVLKSQIEVAAHIGRLSSPGVAIDLAGADGGKVGIDNDIPNPIGKLASITTVNGVITATAIAELDDKTFILTPAVNANRLVWTESGSCQSAGIC